MEKVLLFIVIVINWICFLKKIAKTLFSIRQKPIFNSWACEYAPKDLNVKGEWVCFVHLIHYLIIFFTYTHLDAGLHHLWGHGNASDAVPPQIMAEMYKLARVRAHNISLFLLEGRLLVHINRWHSQPVCAFLASAYPANTRVTFLCDWKYSVRYGN